MSVLVQSRACHSPKGSKRPTILLIGDWTHPEYQSFVQWLGTQSECWSEATIPHAIGLLQDERVFDADLILIAHAYAGQWNQADVYALKAASPLTPIAVISGSCSGSQARNGFQPLGVYHVGWQEAASVLEKEISHWQRGGFRRFALPETLSAEEHFLSRLEEPLASGNGLVAIATADPESGKLLAQLCNACGYASLVDSPKGNWQVTGVSALIWDVEDSTSFVPIWERLNRPPAVALAGFLSLEIQNRYSQLGASAVLSKPFDIVVLSETLSQLVSERAVH